MKKFFIALLFSVICVASAGAEEVQIEIPTFPIKVNYLDVDQSALSRPFIIYNDITYAPAITFETILGITFDNGDVLSINKKENLYDEGLRLSVEDRKLLTSPAIPVAGQLLNNPYLQYQDSLPDISGRTAEIIDKKIEINGEQISADSQYPFLTYADCEYIPLTWEYAVDMLGFHLCFDTESGLEVYADSRFRIVGYSDNIGEYIIKGGDCVYIKTYKFPLKVVSYPPNNLYIAHNYGSLEPLDMVDEELSFGYAFVLREGNNPDCYNPQMEFNFEESSLIINAMAPYYRGTTWRVKVNIETGEVEKLWEMEEVVNSN